MNTTKLLALLLSVIIFASAISVVNATITKEYSKVESYKADTLFSFKVKLVIETEEDGTWMKGESYQIDIFLSVPYLNFSYLYSMIFGNASVSAQGVNVNFMQLMWIPSHVQDSYPVENYKMAEYRAIPTVDGRAKLYPSMDLRPMNKPTGIVIATTTWYGEEPIYIDVKVSSPSLFSPELLFMAIGIVLGAVVIGSYFIIKTRKKTQK